jgi:3-oxoacyl-[acyl-carrier protein] reductase
MGRLNGKVALVTGASKGIGAAIAVQLAAEGAAVVVNYASSKQGADKVVERIVKAGGRAIAVGANLAHPAEIQALATATKEAYGKIDVLVNNAGVYEFLPLDAITPEHIRTHFDLNVMGLLLMTKAAVGEFPGEGGSVINISSGAGRSGAPGGSVYSGTKAAVDTITLSLARELGPRNIRVNAVSPGLVWTEGTAAMKGSPIEMRIVSETPLARVGVPEDIAKVVVFLASAESAWINGEVVQVSGGLR